MSAPSAFVDSVQLSRMVSIASDLPYSIGKILFNFNEFGVKAVLRTKKGDNEFSFSSSDHGEPIKEDVVIQAKMLRNVLRPMSEGILNLMVSEKGIGLKTEKLSLVVYQGS